MGTHGSKNCVSAHHAIATPNQTTNPSAVRGAGCLSIAAGAFLRALMQAGRSHDLDV